MYRDVRYFKGVDLSTATSVASFACLREKGFSFAIPRAFCSDGDLDHHACNNIKHGHEAGMEVMEIYMFPNPRSKQTGKQQLRRLVHDLGKKYGCTYVSPGLKQKNNEYSRIWLDVEGNTKYYWWPDLERNRKFLSDLIEGCFENGVECGIYSTAPEWERIMGNSTLGKGMPLWWASYQDDKPCSLLYMKPFGGWTEYLYHQYRGDDHITVCNVTVDRTCALTHLWTL
eukprot:g33913.t1